MMTFPKHPGPRLLEALFEEWRSRGRWELEEPAHPELKVVIPFEAVPLVYSINAQDGSLGLSVSGSFAELIWPILSELLPEGKLEEGILALPIGQVSLEPRLELGRGAFFLTIYDGKRQPLVLFHEKNEGESHIHFYSEEFRSSVEPLTATLEFLKAEARPLANLFSGLFGSQFPPVD